MDDELERQKKQGRKKERAEAEAGRASGTVSWGGLLHRLLSPASHRFRRPPSSALSLSFHRALPA